MKKKSKKSKTGLFISCSCGSKAAIVETGWGYHAHCPHCGGMSFWKNDSLTEKVRLGSKTLCSHSPKFIDCKGGKTAWCPLCRLRVFMPAS